MTDQKMLVRRTQSLVPSEQCNIKAYFKNGVLTVIIPKSRHYEGCRHTFCTTIVESGASMNEAKLLMR